MVNKKRRKQISIGLQIIGYGIIFSTHIWMLRFNLMLDQMIPHAIINLIAATLLLVERRMKK